MQTCNRGEDSHIKSIEGLVSPGRPPTRPLHLAHSNRLCSLDHECGFVIDEVIFAILSVNFVLLHRVVQQGVAKVPGGLPVMIADDVLKLAALLFIGAVVDAVRI